MNDFYFVFFDVVSAAATFGPPEGPPFFPDDSPFLVESAFTTNKVCCPPLETAMTCLSFTC